MTTELVRPNGHLTVSPDQTFWTDDQKLVLQQTGIDGDVTRAELTGFLHLSQRTGLDPFSRQIYLIGRWDGRAQRKVYSPQTGIDGYRIVAQRTAERTGAQLSYDDALWCGEDGEWHDVWLSAEPPRAAKVTVYRGAARFSAVATYAEYVQLKKGDEPTAMWKRMPAVMLAKCAESLALRKAFPHDLAGVYTAEEMGQADNPRGEGQERAAERPPRRGGPVEDEWSTPAPPATGTAVEDAEVVEDATAVPPEPSITKQQMPKLHALLKEHDLTDRERGLARIVEILDGAPVASTKDLTKAQASRVIDELEKTKPAPAEQPEQAPRFTELDRMISRASGATEFADIEDYIKDARGDDHISEQDESLLTERLNARMDELLAGAR
jgi:phage recombination protein Bet